MFRVDRICPHCQQKLTVDRATKRRLLIAIFLSLVSLYATVHLFIHGSDQLPLTGASYFVFAIFIYYANSKVALVK